MSAVARLKRAAKAALVMSVAFTAGYNQTTSATTRSFTNCDIGALPNAGETREIFVVVVCGATIQRTLNSATINGISATISANQTGSTASQLNCFWATVPTGTSVTIGLTYSGSLPNCHIAIFRVMNRPVTGAADTSFDSNSSSTSVASLDLTALTINAGGFALFGAATGNTANITWSGGGITEVHEATSSSGQKGQAMIDIQGSTVTPTVTCDPATNTNMRVAGWAFA